MADIKKTVADWLRDAYAMENQGIEMLERQTERLKNYPEMLAKAKEHTEVTRRQAERVRQCLERMGESPSTIKTAVSSLIGNAQSLSGIFTDDEVVKAGVFNYGFEQWEIANYTALITAAEQIGDQEMKRLLQENLREEQEMADWLLNHLPGVTRTFLNRQANDQMAEAKR